MNYVDRILGDPDYIQYAANSNKIQKFEKVSNLLYLQLRLSGTLTLAGYSGAPTKLVESVENLISQIMLRATGSGKGTVNDVIKATDFAWAFLHSRLATKTAPQRTDVGTSNAAFNFESNCTLIPTTDKDQAGNPLGLNCRMLAGLLLQVSFRDQTAMVTGGTGGTAVLSNTIVTTHAREVLGAPNVPTRSFLKESQLPFGVTSSALNTKLKDLPTGNRIVRMGFKGTVGSTDYADPSDTVFNNSTPAEGPHVKLIANQAYTVMDQIYGNLRADNKSRFQVETMPAGYSVWQPAKVFDATKAATLEGRVDTNFTGGSTNTIQVTTVEQVRK